MRSALILSALAALALAAPRPQDIDFAQVDAAPGVDPVTPPTDGSTDTVPIQPPSDAAAIGADTVTETTSKRDFINVIDLVKGELFEPRSKLARRDGDCSALPAGTGPQVSSPADDDTSFLNYAPFSAAANKYAASANVPQGYTLAFSNLQSSSQTASYLGYTTLDRYDPVLCQEYCDSLDKCVAFNIYFERDPSVSPNSANCPNPSSVTNIKCVRWGVQIQAATATNNGENRDGFHVVIAGSNGYNKIAGPGPQTGFTGPVELGGAINAPLDPVTNQNTYMGYKFFSLSSVQSFNDGVTACTAACTAQTGYNSRHPPSTGKPQVCNQVVVYVLSDNNVPQGVYCTMYSEEWAQNYATNVGQYRGSDWWGVSQAYAYTSSSYAAQYGPICAVGGCPNGSFQGGNCGGWGAGTC